LTLQNYSLSIPLEITWKFSPKELLHYENVKLHLKKLFAYAKGVYYKHLVHYQPIKQEVILSLDGTHSLSPQPQMFFGCIPKKIKHYDQLYNYEHETKHYWKVSGIELTLSSLYRGKLVEATLIFPHKELQDPQKVCQCLRFLMAYHKLEFYNAHDP